MQSATPNIDIEALFPEPCRLAESYGLDLGLVLSQGLADAPFVTFYCQLHPGWGPILEYSQGPVGFNELWSMTSAVESIPDDFDFNDQVAPYPVADGLGALEFMARTVEAMGYDRSLTAPMLLLYQQRRHLWYDDHVAPSVAVAHQHLREAAEMMMEARLTDAQKLDAMQRRVRLPELRALLDRGLQYSLASEMFPRGTADIHS